MVDKDVGNVELRDGQQASGIPALQVAPETPRPVEHVEESKHRPTPNFFLDALQPKLTAEEFFQAVALRQQLSRKQKK